jgi:phosphonate transport system substrate-binding protein
MTMRWVFMAVLTAAAMGAASCKTASPGATSNEPLELERPVKFGLTRPTGERAAKFSAGKLSAYLAAAFGPGSTANVFDDATLLADALVTQSVDVAWLTPGAYVRARAKDPEIHALVKLSRDGFTSYRSVFFAKAGSKVVSLPTAEGTTLALAGEDSMSGRVYPLAYLKKQGIVPEKYFSKVLSGKDHREVCQLVFSGQADVGATLSDDHGQEPAAADGCRAGGFDPAQFMVIGSTGSVPNDVIAVRAGLDPEAEVQLKRLFMRMSNTDGGRAELKGIFHATGFAEASDADFTAARELEGILSMPGGALPPGQR